MKKILKVIIIFTVIVIVFVSVSNFDVHASVYTPTESSVLDKMNTSLTINEGDYDDYTNSEDIPEWADFYNVNVHNYHDPRHSFCGFYMNYTKKPTIFSKGNATIHGDDPIIYLVPKELFIHRGIYTYTGKEYGFFVNTKAYSSNGDLKTANLVDVFIYDIEAIYNLSEEEFTYTITPLYVFTFIYLSEYIFYNNSEIVIENFNLSLDSEAYSSYSDVVIPLPRPTDEKESCIYGYVYQQNYEETQPNKDLYAIKDSFAFVNITNAHMNNVFDSNYDVNLDSGYIINRSYALYSGYGISSVNVDLQTANQSKANILLEGIGMINPKIGKALDIGQIVYDCYVLLDYKIGDTHIGYELKELNNNPSDYNLGGRTEQIDKNNSLWKIDAKSITSNNNNALVFRPLTYDDLGFPEYNYISYHWDLDSVSKSEAYLTYGSRIQISYANESNDSFEEIGIATSSFNLLIGKKQHKNVTIFEKTRGYMIQDGKYDSFSFTPEYSGYYTISVPSHSTIKLYENDKVVASNYGTVSFIFDKEKKYYFEVEIGHFPQNSRAYDVSIKPFQITSTKEIILNDYILSGSNESIIKIYCTQDDLYTMEMYSINNSIEIPIGFEIYDEGMNIIDKFSIESYTNDAISIQNFSSVNVFLEKGNYYYVRFNIPSSGEIHYNLLNVQEEYQLSEEYKLASNIGDKISLVNIPYNSNYKVSYSFTNNGQTQNNMIFVVYKLHDNSLTLENFIKCNVSKLTISLDIQLLKGDILYFGYFNGNDLIDYTFFIEECPAYSFTITTETDYATETTGLGTEVTVNNGDRYYNTIAIGFTRVLYLGNDAEFDSRYNDYVWISTDPSVATVSAFGTVFAKKVGSTIIRVTDKYNLNHVATLEIIVYEKAGSTSIVSLTTDSNVDESLNGTEYSKLGGNAGETIVHVGYTRSICIVSGGPTNIRQDYVWTSSDNSIATVDIYGIVHGVSKGTVTITCINKYDDSYIGTIVITVI